MAARLEGFRREAGLSRRYVTPSGQTISYRQYRSLLIAADRVQHLDIVQLANRRKSQLKYNDLLKSAVDKRRKLLENRLEVAEEYGNDDEAEDIAQELRRLKSSTAKASETKQALKDLKRLGHKKHLTKDQGEQLKQALTLLGKREGIPDWVPVGMSDRARAGDLTRGRNGRIHDRSILKPQTGLITTPATGTRRSKG